MRCRKPILTAILLVCSTTAFAEAPQANAPASADAKTAPAKKERYSTTETDLGTILDNPAAKAIVEKHIPGLTTNDQIDMARAMTLKDIQAYSPDEVTDARLAAIDADFEKL